MQGVATALGSGHEPIAKGRRFRERTPHLVEEVSPRSSAVARGRHQAGRWRLRAPSRKSAVRRSSRSRAGRSGRGRAAPAVPAPPPSATAPGAPPQLLGRAGPAFLPPPVPTRPEPGARHRRKTARQRHVRRQGYSAPPGAPAAARRATGADRGAASPPWRAAGGGWPAGGVVRCLLQQRVPKGIGRRGRWARRQHQLCADKPHELLLDQRLRRVAKGNQQLLLHLTPKHGRALCETLGVAHCVEPGGESPLQRARHHRSATCQCELFEEKRHALGARKDRLAQPCGGLRAPASPEAARHPAGPEPTE